VLFWAFYVRSRLAQSRKCAGIFAGPQQAFKPVAEIVALAGKGEEIVSAPHGADVKIAQSSG
jgi:hypothetical protein